MDDTPSFSISNRKIDPSRRRATGLKPDGTPDDNDRVEIGPTQRAFDEWAALGLEAPNLETMRRFRLDRLTAALQARDYAGILLFDPLNIRYATDCTNMQLWITHNPARASFVSADGHIVLWDFQGCQHLSSHLSLVREVRTGGHFFYFTAGDTVDDRAREFAAEVDFLLREHSGGNRRLAVDRIEVAGVRAFDELGIEIKEGQEVTEHTRSIKGPDEIKAMRCAVATCEIAIAEMAKVMRPGITENDLWSVLHAENIKRGGEWIETRILSSGQRTNPWFQECGPRVIEDGDIVAFDTDLIGPYGMCADMSRTWFCGDGEPTDEQKRIFEFGHGHVTTNMELLKPGVSFTELTRKGQRLPDEFRDQRYGVMMHGVGLCDEWPAIYYPEDFIEGGFDYELQPGMVICVEVYAGAVGGRDGVKLEEQVLITEDGHENLCTYPFDAKLLG